MKKKTLGILGGMGPLAGAHFYRRVIELSEASEDAEHIPVVLLGDGRIPDRTAHLAKGGESPLPYLEEKIKCLTACGANVIAMPCNTAHAYFPSLLRITTARLLHMPRIAVAYAADRGIKQLGILATRGTVCAGIYQEAVKTTQIKVRIPSPPRVLEIEEMIYKQKAGEVVKSEAYTPYIEELLAEGADAVLLACTEISTAFQGERHRSVIDALEILAAGAVRACGGDIKRSGGNDLF